MTLDPWTAAGVNPPKEIPVPNRKRKKPITKTEPALIRGAVVGVLSLLAALGVSWAADVDKETIGAIVAIAAVAIPLAQAWWTRRAVVPAEQVAIPRREGGHADLATVAVICLVVAAIPAFRRAISRVMNAHT